MSSLTNVASAWRSRRRRNSSSPPTSRTVCGRSSLCCSVATCMRLASWVDELMTPFSRATPRTSRRSSTHSSQGCVWSSRSDTSSRAVSHHRRPLRVVQDRVDTWRRTAHRSATTRHRRRCRDHQLLRWIGRRISQLVSRVVLIRCLRRYALSGPTRTEVPGVHHTAPGVPLDATPSWLSPRLSFAPRARAAMSRCKPANRIAAVATRRLPTQREASRCKPANRIAAVATRRLPTRKGAVAPCRADMCSYPSMERLTRRWRRS